MKYSMSILIFLFASSTVSAFYYASDRTNGKIGPSIIFTVHYLLIKTGLIGPTAVEVFDPPQQNQQLVVKVGVLPVYHPYISAVDDCPSRLYMGETKIKRLAPHYPLSASPITELRAGSRSEDIKQTAYLFATIWWAMKLHQTYGLQPQPNQMRIAALNNAVYKNQKPDPLFCQQQSAFDPQKVENSVPYSVPIMSSDDANGLIIKQYGTQSHLIDVSEDLTVTYEQLAKKIYHALSYKVNPELYGMTKDQLKAINNYGLKNYIKCGGELPSEALINTYYQGIKVFYEQNKLTLNRHGAFRGQPAIIVHNNENGTVLVFDSSTGRLWMPGHLRPNQMRRYLETGAIGKQSSVIPPGTTPPPKAP